MKTLVLCWMATLGVLACQTRPAAERKASVPDTVTARAYQPPGRAERELMQTLQDQSEEVQERIEETDARMLNAPEPDKARWKASRSRLWAEKANLDRYVKLLNAGDTTDSRSFHEKVNRSLSVIRHEFSTGFVH